ncbi:acetamidase/formamidase family protein [Aestuariivirga sp.]|uniref:acetamidase/formamidase family protein n=1 Tax=Aestuariivirga sp. TaxID=2650926 RepID=UPI00391D67FD
MDQKKHEHTLGCKHTIHQHQQNLCWDNSIKPAMTVAPGDTIEFRDIDATCGQITAKSTVGDIATLDFSRINPIAGPIYVDGAEPGDALKVTLLGFQSSGWAWTAIVPGFGLLADDFPEPALNIWSYDKSFSQSALYGPGAKVPLKPFCGTIGVAPAESGKHSTIPPHSAGGNMDIRDLTVGVELYLPVKVKGALFSIGDTHAAQGDGEVCGTAIESPMSVAAKLELVKGANLRFPRFRTSGPVTRHLDAKGYEVTTGIGPDLMEATKNAVRGMIDLLGQQHNMNAADAYMLCSVCADMRISEVVDQPNWVVSCYLPRIVFD